ncbi:MAG: adenosine deaminase [Chloroflexia bacterium]|nr:adenosine deaminase [Chloroflexia bacterium]
MSETFFLDDLPLVDLHRHLDGNVRLSTILDIAHQHALPLPAHTVEELRPHIEVQEPIPSLPAFFKRFALLQQTFVDYATVYRVTRENLEDALVEGLDYLELRFSPLFMAAAHGLDPIEIGRAACQALAEAADLPIRAKLIVIMSRQFGPEECQQELETALSLAGRGVVAVDLAGDEAGYPGQLFEQHFARARAAGLHTIAHAGEVVGPESVRQAVLGLGAERLGHAVRAAEDPALLDLLAERGIVVESCLTSNLQTLTVPTLADHPLPLFLQRGIRVTLNTDDPVISGIDLPHEYRLLQQLELSPQQVRQVRLNGLEAAFIDPAEKRLLLERARQRARP